MSAHLLTSEQVPDELARIGAFLAVQASAGEPACVLVSGGLDSDVVARLAVRALSPARVKLVTVLQDDMSPAHLAHARALALALATPLSEVDLRGLNVEAVRRLAAADPAAAFDPAGLLDPARMKCSLRTIVASAYQDRGHVVLGTSNRTEVELGFFLPFGDGIWHVGPIAHLYKSEVRLLAQALGTSAEVLRQPPSAGFWEDQTDREDLGFWLVHGGPIQRERSFSPTEEAQAAAWSAQLDETSVDRTLLALASGDPALTGTLAPALAERLALLVARSRDVKNRPLGTTLARR